MIGALKRADQVPSVPSLPDHGQAVDVVNGVRGVLAAASRLDVLGRVRKAQPITNGPGHGPAK